MAFDFRNREEGPFGPPPPPFRIQRRRPSLGALGGANRWIFLAVALLLLYIVLNTLRGIYVDWLWFDSLGYRSVYSKMLTTRVWLFFGGVLVFLAFFGVNLAFASRSLLRTPPAVIPEVDAAALRRLFLVIVIAAAVFLAIIFGTVAASAWDRILLLMNAESFGVKDPQFHRDVGFYVFKLPALRFIQGWLLAMLILTTIVVAGLHLGRFLLLGVAGNDRTARVQLLLLLAAIVGVFLWRYWLGIYDLNFSQRGVVFGATYTDVHARLPAIYISMAMGFVTLAAILAAVFLRGVLLPIVSMVVWVLAAVIAGLVYPLAVQRFNVQPTENDKERTYIKRNIDMTRRAFALDRIQEEPFDAAPEVSLQETRDNPDTMANIRLLDVRPLLQTYAQIQTIRPLYEFNDVDVDRYEIEGQRRQVMVAARELSPSRLPVDAQSWVNRRVQFTHGYGVVMSPVNEVANEGLPSLFMSDIPVQGKVPLQTPQIYFGEEPEHYVIVKTSTREFDYPMGEGRAETTFDGEGGVNIGSRIRRLLFAWEFGDLNIAISSSITGDSRLLFRRNVAERVHTLAPMLTLDRDPYIVVADGRLYWIQDAYTTTTRYPYSRPSPSGFNYIRNSVKAVVDAYDGTTTLYIADDSDPIVKAYARVFPKLFRPLSDMPASLRSHLRYPEDMFLAQVNQYRRYHITDPDKFYQQEDIWTIPTQVTSGAEELMQPYYVTMRIPGESKTEFVLILPLTPARRANTIAWVAARSDDPNYGRMLAFLFPTNASVFGPRQVEARIDQDANISAQFSLWNQSGSRVIRGNLLMIPIGNGNLFIEPIYLQAETSQLPELKRVVVANGNRIAMESTLERSLNVVFGIEQATTPGTSPTTPAGSPQATPTAQATPRATATASPAGTPQTAAELAREADATYKRAQDALRNGDFTTYAQEIARLQDIIARLVAATGGP